jgi:hypothetical protein
MFSAEVIPNKIGNYPGRLRVPIQSAFTEFLRKG